MTDQGAVQLDRLTIEIATLGGMLAQALLVGAAVALPVCAHLAGAPVRLLLPMHWPVILAGLVFGWRGGLLVGLLAPGASYLLSGYPLPPVLVQMSLELATYGGIAGLMRERLRANGFVSVAAALIAGRLVFAGSSLVLMGATGSTLSYLGAALAPGLIAGVLQVFALPPLGGLWIRASQRGSGGRTTGQ